MATLKTTIDDFLIAKEIDQLSPETIKWYRWHLEEFVSHIGDMKLQDVRAATIRKYINDIRGAETHYRGGMEVKGPVQAETISGRLRALKAFFTWCTREKLISRDDHPMLNITIPQPQPGEIKAISMTSVRLLMNSCDDTDIGKRNIALLCFMIDSGARAGGVVTLTPENLFLDKHYAIVHEKGDKSRPIPFIKYTADRLAEWMKVRPPTATTVFCSFRNQSYAEPLTVSGLANIFQRMKKKAGVKGPANPHSFRHAFAREVASASGDIAAVSRLMGHSNISITARSYARFTFHEDAITHERYSPLRNE